MSSRLPTSGTGPNYYPLEYFKREDESNDDRFYQTPRLVVHIDDGAIKTVSEIYGELIPADATILDLMSSWRSHLPVSVMQSKHEVVGHGMNEVELRENPQLDRYVVHNLNLDPTLAFPDDYFDAVTNTVSVQYLTRPIETFKEVLRVLKPGGQYIVAFSNRMFATKAVAIWRYLSEKERVELVESYFKLAGYTNIHLIDRSKPANNSTPGNSLRSLFTPTSDPVYVVVGRKPSAKSMSNE